MGTLHGHELSDESDEAFLGAVGDNNWQVDIEVNGQAKKFYIDTGAEVTVVPELTYKAYGNPELVETRRVLRGPGQHKLKVRGKFTAMMKLGDAGSTFHFSISAVGTSRNGMVCRHGSCAQIQGPSEDLCQPH